eukprot:403374424
MKQIRDFIETFQEKQEQLKESMTQETTQDINNLQNKNLPKFTPNLSTPMPILDLQKVELMDEYEKIYQYENESQTQYEEDFQNEQASSHQDSQLQFKYDSNLEMVKLIMNQTPGFQINTPLQASKYKSSIENKYLALARDKIDEFPISNEQLDTRNNFTVKQQKSTILKIPIVKSMNQVQLQKHQYKQARTVKNKFMNHSVVNSPKFQSELSPLNSSTLRNSPKFQLTQLNDQNNFTFDQLSLPKQTQSKMKLQFQQKFSIKDYQLHNIQLLQNEDYISQLSPNKANTLQFKKISPNVTIAEESLSSKHKIPLQSNRVSPIIKQGEMSQRSQNFSFKRNLISEGKNKQNKLANLTFDQVENDYLNSDLKALKPQIPKPIKLKAKTSLRKKEAKNFVKDKLNSRTLIEILNQATVQIPKLYQDPTFQTQLREGTADTFITTRQDRYEKTINPDYNFTTRHKAHSQLAIANNKYLKDQLEQLNQERYFIVKEFKKSLGYEQSHLNSKDATPKSSIQNKSKETQQIYQKLLDLQSKYRYQESSINFDSKLKSNPFQTINTLQPPSRKHGISTSLNFTDRQNNELNATKNKTDLSNALVVNQSFNTRDQSPSYTKVYRERVTNYGKWYLNPQNFNRVFDDQFKQQSKDKVEERIQKHIMDVKQFTRQDTVNDAVNTLLRMSDSSGKLLKQSLPNSLREFEIPMLSNQNKKKVSGFIKREQRESLILDNLNKIVQTLQM